MVKLIRRIVRKILNKYGFEVVLFNYETSHALVLQKLIQDYQIKTVFDIGANEGQFAQELITNGYSGTIVSFEPLSTAWEKLKHQANRHSNWVVPEQIALGSSEGKVTINIAGNSQSSSILSMENLHSTAAPDSSYVATEEVKLTTLDSFLHNHPNLQNPNILIKVDTQGYEMDVLRGAEETLKKAVMVEVELSFAELYKGQTLYKGVIDFMESHGFQLWSLFPIFTDKSTARLLQADAIFVRKNNS